MPLPKSILCKKCDRTYPEGWRRCPYCGHDEVAQKLEAQGRRFMQKKLQEFEQKHGSTKRRDDKRAAPGERPPKSERGRSQKGRGRERQRPPERPGRPAVQQQKPQRPPRQPPPPRPAQDPASLAAATDVATPASRNRRRRRRGRDRAQGGNEPRPQNGQSAASQAEPRPAAPPQQGAPRTPNGEAGAEGDGARKRRRFRRRRRGGGGGGSGQPPSAP